MSFKVASNVPASTINQNQHQECRTTEKNLGPTLRPDQTRVLQPGLQVDQCSLVFSLWSTGRYSGKITCPNVAHESCENKVFVYCMWGNADPLSLFTTKKLGGVDLWAKILSLIYISQMSRMIVHARKTFFLHAYHLATQQDCSSLTALASTVLTALVWAITACPP